MLYLIENPVVREAFFPSGTPQFSVELAQPKDSRALRAIIQAHEGEEAGAVMVQWWRRLRRVYLTARDLAAYAPVPLSRKPQATALPD